MEDESRERYCPFARNGYRGLAERTDADRIIAALLDRIKCEPVDAMGRGALYRFPLQSGAAILREYRRGGLMQRVLREGSLQNRPLREWEVLRYLHDASFPVPEPVGVIWRRRIGWVRGAIATREIRATDLLAYLSANPPANERASMLDVAGKMIRRMHDLNVYHADLHVGNILVSHPESCHLVDFDKARMGTVTPLLRARNLLRLKRSFIKRGLRLTDFERIRLAYGPLAMPSWLEWMYGAKGAASDSVRRHSDPHVL